MHVCKSVTRNHLNGSICPSICSIHDAKLQQWRIAQEGRQFVCSQRSLSEGYLNDNEDRRAYTQLVEEYFAESGDKTEADTEN